MRLMLAQHRSGSNLRRGGPGRGVGRWPVRALLGLLIAAMALLPSLSRPPAPTTAASVGPRPAVGKVRWAYYVSYAGNSLASLKEFV